MRDFKSIVFVALTIIFLLTIIGVGLQDESEPVAIEDSVTYCTQNEDISDEDIRPKGDEANTRKSTSYVRLTDLNNTRNVPQTRTFKPSDEDQHNLITKFTICNAYLMAEADSNSFAIEKIPQGTPVQLFEDCDCEWVCVAFNNHYGYIRSDILQKEKHDNVESQKLVVKESPQSSNQQSHPAYSSSPVSSKKTNASVPVSNVTNNTPPDGATALCRDGTYSFSKNHKGTCSWHGGVAKWLDQ